MSKIILVDFLKSKEELCIECFLRRIGGTKEDYGFSEGSTILVYDTSYYIQKFKDGTYDLVICNEYYKSEDFEDGLTSLEQKLFEYVRDHT